MHIDPDLWLHNRLTIGRGWLAVASLTTPLLAVVSFAAISRQVDRTSIIGRDPVVGHPILVFYALLFLLGATAFSVGRLLQTDRQGLLDHTRLCGRHPSRVLLAFLLGSTWLYVATPVAMVAANCAWFSCGVAIVWPVMLAYLTGLVLALLLFGLWPGGVSPAILVGVLLIGGLGALVVMGFSAASVSYTFDLRQPVAVALLAAAVPLVLRSASRRIVRPAQPRPDREWMAALLGVAVRVTPWDGPPEFIRQLRRVVPIAGAFGAVAVLIVMAVRVAVGPVVAVSVLVVVLLIAAAIADAWGAVWQETSSGTFDFVRLSPQAPGVVALSWYAGIALPWLVVLLATSLATSLPRTIVAGYVSVAAILMVVALADGFFLGRLSGALVAALVFGVLSAGLRSLRERAFTLAVPELAILLGFIAFLALVVVAGRIRSVEGPALAGAGAAVVMTGIALIGGLTIPPRAVVGMLALFAVFAAEDRRVPTPPWRRLAVAGGAACAGVLAAAWSAWLEAVVLVTVLCTALAVGIAVLGHELLQRVSLVSVGTDRLPIPVSLVVPIALMVGIQRWPFGAPPLLQPVDVIGLAAAFLALAAAHAKLRGAAA